MGRFSEKQLLILTISISFLLSAGLGFLIWRDFRTIEEEQQTIEDLKTQIEAAEGEIKQIPAREHRVIANREISDKEVAFLPEETEIESFWEVLWRFAEESGVQISEITPNVGRRTGKGGTISEVRQLLSVRGHIDEFIRFINHLENYDRIINVVEYSVRRGDVADEDGKVRHGIRLQLSTFTYSKKIANTIVSITHYEKKREHPEVKQWLSKIKLQEKETYTLRTSLNRRDPFVNIRKPILKAGPGPSDGPKIREQEQIVDQLVEMVRSLKEGLDIEDHLRKIKDLFRLAQQQADNREAFTRLKARIDDVQRQKMIKAPALIERMSLEVLQPFNEIKERMGKMQESEPKRSVAEVQEWLTKTKKAFDERNWMEVSKLVHDFRELTKDGERVEDDARSMVAQITGYLKSSQVIQRFEKRRISISTILYSPNQLSVAIINGKQYQAGDALDGDGTVVIVEIGENYVIFETEGVEIKRKMK